MKNHSHLLSDAKRDELNAVSPYLFAYSTFVKAKNLGITVSAKDIDIETLNIFEIIRVKIDEIESKKRDRKAKTSRMRHGTK